MDIDETERGLERKRAERSDARENRAQILAVAKYLFAQQGIAATSMHEIARAAGVGQGTLYRHFAHKGDLCHALIKQDLTDFCERVGMLIQATQADQSPLARLDLLIVEKNCLTEGHLPLFAAMDEAPASLQRQKSGPGMFHAWLHEQMVALLNEAQAVGEIASLDVEFTAETILAAIAPQPYSYQRHTRGYSVERINAGMRELFIERLRYRRQA
jgi:AcrR family transcriptional regulator